MSNKQEKPHLEMDRYLACLTKAYPQGIKKSWEGNNTQRALGGGTTGVQDNMREKNYNEGH
jgi:hypothetical protein